MNKSKKSSKQEKGLTLAGGGSRGAFQMGTWKAFREMDLVFDYVAGTSIGAINGALMACGHYKNALKMWENIQMEQCLSFADGSPTELNDLLNMKNVSTIVKEFLTHKNLNTGPLRELLEKYIDEDCVRNSPLRFGLMTAEMPKLSPLPIWIEDVPKGKLIDFIMASARVPGLKPVNINGVNYIDGGIVDNMPIDMLKKRGVRNITAVELNTHSTLKSPLLDNIQLTFIHDARDLGGMFDLTPDVLERNRTLGYLNAKKTYHLLDGDLYFFTPETYRQLKDFYNAKTVQGLEQAAIAYEIPRDQVYTGENFLAAIQKKRTAMETVYAEKKAALKIENKMSAFMKGTLKMPDLIPPMQLSFLMELYMQARENDTVPERVLKYFTQVSLAAEALLALDEKNAMMT